MMISLQGRFINNRTVGRILLGYLLFFLPLICEKVQLSPDFFDRLTHSFNGWFFRVEFCRFPDREIISEVTPNGSDLNLNKRGGIVISKRDHFSGHAFFIASAPLSVPERKAPVSALTRELCS